MKYLSCIFLMLSLPAWATNLQLREQEFSNQWEQSIHLNKETKIVFFATDMDGNSIIKESFNTQKIKTLKDKNWLYVADISGMPSLITSMFALPKMKKYTFPIALDYEGEITKNWPKQEEKAVVFELKQLAIEKVLYFDDQASLSQFIETKKNQPAPPTPTHNNASE